MISFGLQIADSIFLPLNVTSIIYKETSSLCPQIRFFLQGQNSQKPYLQVECSTIRGESNYSCKASNWIHLGRLFLLTRNLFHSRIDRLTLLMATGKSLIPVGVPLPRLITLLYLPLYIPNVFCIPHPTAITNQIRVE